MPILRTTGRPARQIAGLSSGSTVRSVRLLAVRRRQRGATRNLAAKRAVDVLAKLGQPLDHAVRHATLNRLHGATITTVEKFFYRRHTLGLGGKPCQLSNRLRAVFLGQLLDLGATISTRLSTVHVDLVLRFSPLVSLWRSLGRHGWDNGSVALGSQRCSRFIPYQDYRVGVRAL